jgi:autotransporter-associated beta strand protein
MKNTISEKKQPFSICFSVLFRWPALVSLCAGLFFIPAYGAVWSWSGGGGANAYWNNSANWGFAGTPTNGDTVIFPASRPNELNTNNIPGLALNQIVFAGAGGGYDIRGNAFTLTNGIIATNTTGANTIENDIALATATSLMVISNEVSLTLDGSLSGSVGVTKAGLGTLLYQCPFSDNSGNNSYTGTTLVAGGTLQLNCSGYNAISGPLVIGDGTGAGTPTVQYLQKDEMKYLSSVTINQSGLLDLNNYNEDLFTASLTMSGGTISTGTGTLTLPANSTINATPDIYACGIDGNLNNGSGTLTLQGENNLYIYANVSGTASIVQTNANTFWYGANTYTGNYTANGAGFLVPASSQALGNPANNLTVNGQVSIDVYDDVNLTNQSVTLNSTNSSGYRIAVYSSSTNSTWQSSFTNNAGIEIDVATNCAMTLVGTISGPGGLTEFDSGTLTLAGTNYNTYAGTTTVSGGTLLLDKGDFAIAVPSPLVIGSGTTVRELANFQIDSFTTPVTMNNSSVWDLNGFTDVSGPISMQGAQIINGDFLDISADITVYSSTVAQSLISGIAQIYGSIITINTVGHNFSPDLVISANINSGGSTNGLILAGAGEVSLTGNNSFTGPVTVNGGNLWARTSTALGSSTNNPVTVNNGGSLFLDGTGLDFGLKPLVLNGTGYSFGALSCNGSSSWEGNVTLASDSQIDTFSASSLNLAGAINGPGALTATGSGSLTFSGSIANAYAGLTTVNGGTLVLGKATGTLAVPNNLVVNSGSTVRLASSLQTMQSADVLVNSGGLLDFSAYTIYFDTLRGSGTVNFGVNGWVELGWYNGTSEFDGSFTGTGYASGWTVGKTGSGTFTIGGNSSYTAGITHVLQGKIVINGSQPQIPVTVDSGAIIGGSGTVGIITANGMISPGTSPVILNSSNVTFSASGNFTVNLTGPNPGPGGYDQLNVSGTVSLANATLTVIPAFTVPVSIGQQFTILNHNGTGPITGTFNGFPEGSLFTAGAYKFRISYVGGTGNDVVLTLWGVPGNTVTVDAVATGWYDSSGSGVPGNYAAGYGNLNIDTNTYRNWFVFNMPLFSGSIIHAELLVNSYVNTSPNGQETYLVRKVTTPVASLVAGGSGLVGIYNDLAANAVYSVRSVATNESGMTAIIPLDVQFFNDAAAASGSQIALGGSVATLNPTNNHNQLLFGFSLGNPGDVQLRLTFGSSVVINSADRGWYASTGSHTGGFPNYFVGSASGVLYNDYFLFNLPTLSSQLVDAQLLVNDYSVGSPSGIETYQLYDVTNSITALTNSQATATNIYADLGSGVFYGGRNIFGSENGLFSSISLNGSFVAAALTNNGGQIALGGTLVLNSAPTNEYLFAGSGGPVTDAQLWLGFLNAPISHPGFVAGTPTYLGNNQFQIVVTGTAGTTNEIQGSFDFTRWDFINDVIMTGSSTSFIYTNTTSVLPYRFFRAEQLQ